MKENMISEMYRIIKNEIPISNTNFQLIKKLIIINFLKIIR